MNHFPILIFVKYNLEVISPKKQKNRVRRPSNIFKISDVHIYKNNIVQDVSIFSCTFLGVLVSPKMNKVGFGAW